MELGEMHLQIRETLKRDPDYLMRLIDEHEAANLLGFTVRALQNWRVRGGGPKFVKLSKRSVRYRRADLLEWIENNIRRHTSQG